MSDADMTQRVYDSQRIVRFMDLDEVFFARAILGCVRSPFEKRRVTINFTLQHLFPRCANMAELKAEAAVSFELTERLSEQASALISQLEGRTVRPRSRTTRAFDFYCEHTRWRLEYLRDGDNVIVDPMIEGFTEVNPGEFQITLDTGILIPKLLDAIARRLELNGSLIAKAAALLPPVGPRITYKKQLDLLVTHLNERRKITGEELFQFTSREIPFRHAITRYESGFAMPSPGTTGPGERILLPLYLEATALLDILHVALSSSPGHPLDIEVTYTVRMPAALSMFGARGSGLAADQRRQLNEIQLSIYHRVHEELQASYVFLGRAALEDSFATLASWMLRKLSYSLEEPTFIGRRATQWLQEHAGDTYKKMEDDFFLPFMHEKLCDAFPDRIVKKPKAYGGENDLLFDKIPIELKVRREHSRPLIQEITHSYAPTAQAAAYAAETRLAVVCVLDLPLGAPALTNLDSCVFTFERETETEFSTRVVLFIFQCHHPKPSAAA